MLRSLRRRPRAHDFQPARQRRDVGHLWRAGPRHGRQALIHAVGRRVPLLRRDGRCFNAHNHILGTFP